MNSSSASEHTPWTTLITRPTSFFESRREKPSWVGIALVTTVILAAAGVIQFTVMEHSASFQASLGKLTPQTAAIAKTVGIIVAPIGVALEYWIVLLLNSFLVWVVAKFARGPIGFVQALAVTANANIATVIATAINAVILLATGPSLATFLSLGMFMTGAGPNAIAIANSISLFTIWYLYLETVAVSVFGRMSKGKAFLIVFIVWLIFFLMQFLFVQMHGIAPTPKA